MEDWALIRRLVADGVPQRQVARNLGVGRSTVSRAVASQGPPKYERPPVPTSFTPFEALVRAILVELPDMPTTVIAERVGWTGSITWFRDNVRRLRPEHRMPDPADRLIGSVALADRAAWLNGCPSGFQMASVSSTKASASRLCAGASVAMS